MASSRVSRFRHALRLVASVFLLSSPCQGGWMTSPPARSLPEAAAEVPPVAGDRRLFAGTSHPVR
jgi:hypothetical protein